MVERWSSEDELLQVLADPIQADILRVLRREDDGIDALRAPVDIFDGDLRLAVRAQVGERLVFAYPGELTGQQVGELDRHRHQLGRFIAGKPEHHPLIAGPTGVDALRDVGRLLLDRHDHATGFGIEAETRMVITGLLDGVPNHVAHLDVGVGRDLANHEGQSGGHRGLAGHAT